MLLLFVGLNLIWILSLNAQDRTDSSGKKSFKTGSLRGKVIDAETSSPLAAVNIRVKDTDSGAVSDPSGDFVIRDLPVGSYTLQFRIIGYKPLSRTDIIVKSDRYTSIEAELHPTYLEGEDVTVTAGYFAEEEDDPVSTISFSSEEIRRAPGSAGDVSRIVSGLPSISKVNDQLNSLVVRGGSPSENAFFIDNIEIPNINHYPLQGSSGGPIGLLNVDFIEDVDFTAGGFRASYGNRLSSVMQLDFREGNREEYDFQLDLHMAGVGAVGEGPIADGRGSWMLSVRKSILDLLVDAIATGVAPRYSDYQGKLVYDLSPHMKLSFLGIAGVDFIEFDKDQSFEDGNAFYGKHEGYEYATGINLKSLYKSGFSNTSVSYMATKYEADFTETKSDQKLLEENTLESSARFRNVNFFRLNNHLSTEFGAEAKYQVNDYDKFEGEYTNPFGDTTPPLIVNREIEAPVYGAFGSFVIQPLESFTTTLGARYDYFDYSGHSHISPRISVSCDLDHRTSLNAAFGIYYQSPPLLLLSQDEDFKDLKDLESYHYILGASRLLWEDTRLTLEGYYKDYRNFPLDPDQPQSFVIDEMIYYGYAQKYNELIDEGEARSYGIEMILQKKLVEGIYGLVSASYSKSEYKALDDVWRDRLYDNGLVFSIEGGYKPNSKWEYSLRWIYAGGTPYTPLDLEASRLINRSVYDRNRVNQARMPDYHSLNLRVDRRFHFSHANLIVYFSVWNAYNRENVANYYWNEIEEKQDVIYQWTFLPVFGMELEF